MFKENPLTILQIFVSEQRELIQSSIHFYCKKVRVGSYLREYDYSKREFIKLPWRVTRIDSYHLSEAKPKKKDDRLFQLDRPNANRY